MSEQKYTPEQRLSMYKEVLRLMLENERWGIVDEENMEIIETHALECGECPVRMGLCGMFYHLFEAEVWDLPEIWDQKPEVKCKEDFWYPEGPEGRACRIQALQNAIAAIDK